MFMGKNSIYRSKLKFMNGDEKIVPIEGKIDDEDYLHMPEIVMFDNAFFTLQKNDHKEDYFLYHETPMIVEEHSYIH